ncbi:lysozyme inhibitor LprI family protein [Acinetobacter johnsonii]|uniref:lysozyme inhibitor LprI family protein n=1 Tax=Acinetobacter johnsonii TaxID=40214 RepID=UPI003984DF09
MPKFYLQILVLLATFSGAVHAQQQEAEPDIYNQCVEQTIQALQLVSINNSVVEICSERAKHLDEKKIVSLLDQIRVQSQQDSQPERYQAILKSQRLWKAYVEQECDNAGQYVGSPMYAFCPMLQYAERVVQLQQYVH